MPHPLVWQVHVYVSIMSSFSVESTVRGYHVYKDIWDAVVVEEFSYKREDGNRVDPFAVAVMRGDTVIGYVPRKILSICSLYLRRDGSIVCRMTGSRWFSVDLAQGGLEILCVLTFQGDAKHTAKAKKLVESALATTTTTLSASKKRKQSDVPTDVPADLPSTSDCKDSTPELTKEWVQLAGIVLTSSDKQHILDGEKLNNRHINMAQGLLKQQFSETTGLKSTLLQAKKQRKEDNKLKIQIIHCCGEHWIAASTLLAADDEVKVYDSVYRTLDRATKSIISNLFQTLTSTELVGSTGRLVDGIVVCMQLPFQQLFLFARILLLSNSINLR